MRTIDEIHALINQGDRPELSPTETAALYGAMAGIDVEWICEHHRTDAPDAALEILARAGEDPLRLIAETMNDVMAAAVEAANQAGDTHPSHELIVRSLVVAFAGFAILEEDRQ